MAVQSITRFLLLNLLALVSVSELVISDEFANTIENNSDHTSVNQKLSSDTELLDREYGVRYASACEGK